jgi:hypothetical protein
MLNIQAIIDTHYYGVIQKSIKLSDYAQKKSDDAIAKTYAFKTRQEYFEWVKEWKEEYKKLTVKSRGYKSARKLGSKPFNGMTGNEAQMEMLRLRRIARAMLFVRAEAKKRSWQMKLENDLKRFDEQSKLRRISLMARMRNQ